jgi:hypothetical protein
VFGNGTNKSELHSQRNEEVIEIRECLLPFNSEFSSCLLSKIIKSKKKVKLSL